jgi:divalent metal cation (Fe/Co/Zn/Cd) transporter
LLVSFSDRTAGKKANSAAVIANAWQHRSDAIISAAVLAGLMGSMLGYPILDPAAGVLVAGVILNQVKISLFDLVFYSLSFFIVVVNNY